MRIGYELILGRFARRSSSVEHIPRLCTRSGGYRCDFASKHAELERLCFLDYRARIVALVAILFTYGSFALANSEISDPTFVEEEEERPNIFKRMENHVQGRVLKGLLELVPLLVTVLVIVYLVNATNNFFRELPFIKDQPWDVPGIGLLILVIIFYLVGLLAIFGVGQLILSGVHRFMNFIPVVRTLYGVTEQAMASVGSSANFSRVVFIEWPRDGMMALGFVTGRARAPSKEEDLVSVYVPTVPNPTSGNMAWVLEDDVVETDMSVEDAMKLIFSGGIVLPESISMARMPRPSRSGDSFVGKYDRG